jgi:acetyltransferase-like isoleucine patch superfamily enzyme
VIAPTAIIHPGVKLGAGAVVEDFCIIGAPFRNYNGEPTVIGDGALIRSHTVIYAGNVIGKNFQTGNKVNIRELNEIGDDVSVGTLSVIEHHVKVGNGARIHTQVFVPEFSTLEEGAWLGPNVVLTNAKFPQSPNVKNELKGPLVRKGAKIGANATILPGVELGGNCLVGAGSVVTKDVEPSAVVGGNPAKKIGTIKY